MNLKSINAGLLLAAAGTATLFAGCGGGSDRPKSLDAAVAEIESPTGTVSADTAVPVADEFSTAQTTNSGSLFGTRDEVRTLAQAQSTSLPCDSGNIQVSGSGNQSSGKASLNYNNCCYSGCCSDGVGDIFYSDGTSDYLNCFSFDLTTTCEGQEPVSLVSSACTSAEGLVVSVEVQGETFSVSGFYSEGNGELTIRGANGTFSCSYTDYAGTCVDETGAEFTF